jgi:hypothetical protein
MYAVHSPLVTPIIAGFDALVAIASRGYTGTTAAAVRTASTTGVK